MVQYDKGPSGYKKYQDWFQTRYVGIYNHGVPDYEEEMMGIVDDIKEVPWHKFNEDEKAAIGRIAIESMKALMEMEIKKGENDCMDIVGDMTNLYSELMNQMLEYEDPFGDMRWDSPLDDIDL